MILVGGLGLTGQSVLRYFALNQEPVLAFDSRETLDITELEVRFPQVRFATGQLPKNWLHQVKTLVLSPGISVHEPWVQQLQSQGVQVIGDIELFARAVGVPVIGITGSNGKSSVTTLVGMALSQAGYCVAVGGNIGVPALDLLSDDVEYEVYVLELSSFQLETTYSLHTISSALLNLSEDHMDRYDDMNAYLQAKLNVFNDTDLAVCPEEMDCGLLATQPHCRFGLKTPANDQNYGLLSTRKGLYLAKGHMPLIAVDKMKLQGRHHQLNALAMMALVEPFRICPEDLATVLASFEGLAHRTQEVACVNGVRWVNDSKGTNVGATLTALNSLGEQITGKIILLAGGVDKAADFSGLTHALNLYVSHLLLFGQDRERIATATGFERTQLFATMEQAIAVANDLAQPGDLVLLSPACASFDQFQHYVHRGEVFIKTVQSLLGLIQSDPNG